MTIDTVPGRPGPRPPGVRRSRTYDAWASCAYSGVSKPWGEPVAWSAELQAAADAIDVGGRELIAEVEGPI